MSTKNTAYRNVTPYFTLQSAILVLCGLFSVVFCLYEIPSLGITKGWSEIDFQSSFLVTLKLVCSVVSILVGAVLFQIRKPIFFANAPSAAESRDGTDYRITEGMKETENFLNLTQLITCVVGTAGQITEIMQLADAIVSEKYELIHIILLILYAIGGFILLICFFPARNAEPTTNTEKYYSVLAYNLSLTMLSIANTIFALVEHNKIAYGTSLIIPFMAIISLLVVFQSKYYQATIVSYLLCQILFSILFFLSNGKSVTFLTSSALTSFAARLFYQRLVSNAGKSKKK